MEKSTRSLKEISFFFTSRFVQINKYSSVSRVTQAWLRLDRRTSRVERLGKVDELISYLGLADRADTRIGDTGSDKVLSGGEKKRLAFASEVIINFVFNCFVCYYRKVAAERRNCNVK
jgi:ABC-type multidrug transport system ATPase subunit